MTTTTGGAASVYSALEMWLQTEWSDLDVHLNSVTDQYSTVAVVGPNARKLMKLLCQDVDFERENFKFMQWRQGTVVELTLELCESASLVNLLMRLMLKQIMDDIFGIRLLLLVRNGI
jgi:glycine cleavage system aminomethyltransferase T